MATGEHSRSVATGVGLGLDYIFPGTKAAEGVATAIEEFKKNAPVVLKQAYNSTPKIIEGIKKLPRAVIDGLTK